jgi:hypothetical protein
MATLRSLYTAEATAFVPTDLLPPGKPSLIGSAQQAFQQNSVAHGRSVVTIAWSPPTTNETIGGEVLGVADGLAQNLETTYDPVEAGEEVYEMSNYGGGGRGDTTLAANAFPKAKSVTVTDPANFAIGDWVQLDDGVNREYAKIASIAASVLTFEQRLLCCASFFPATTTTVKEATAVLKTGGGTDYTLTAFTGEVAIVAGQFTASNDISIRYTTTVQDLDGFTLIRNPALLTDTSYEAVSVEGSSVLVSDAIASGATSHADTLTAAENGEDWYYYLYAQDDETVPNRSEVAVGGPLLVETIPSIPQNLTASPGDEAVILGWDTLGPGGSDTNVDGYNVYRNSGATLDPPNLDKLNAVLVPTGTLEFKDSQAGIDDTSRVGSGAVPLPVNGQLYTYVIETEDSTTAWTTGTQNQSNGVAAQLTASKTP